MPSEPGTVLGRKGLIESAITSAMVHYQAELIGHGPTEARTYILEDMVIVRFKGSLSRVEQRLAELAGLGKAVA